MNIALFIQKASYVNGGESYLTMLEVELAKTIKQYKEDLSQLYVSAILRNKWIKSFVDMFFSNNF